MPRTPRIRDYLRIPLLLLALLLCAGLPARAQGRIAPGIAWCGGIRDAADLPAIRAAGFDTVRIDIPWTATPTWDTYDRLIAAAQAQKMRVILAPQLTAPPADAGAVDSRNSAYTSRVKTWIERVVEHYQNNGAVLAWMTPDEPEAVLQVSAAGFRAYIAERYKDISLLNRAWGSRYSGFSGVSADGVLMLSRQPQNALGINRAAIDLALYRQQSFTQLMRLWARFLRTADAGRPLLTGAIGRYRCLISVTEEYEGVVARVAPGGADAVAVARHGGRFMAIAALPPADLLGGMSGALLQGAAGIAVEDWRSIRAYPRAQAALKAALDGWRKRGAPSNNPQPTAAILYEPFGDNFANPSPLFTGYLTGTDSGDLDPLFAAFRGGTALGQVDYLGREDLPGQSLSRYRVLFCPMTLSLSAEELGVLQRYAEAGGVVVADVGFGCYEAGGKISSWSPQLASLLGIRALYTPMPGGGTLRFFENLALFPSIRPGDSFTAGAPFRDLAVLIEPLSKSTPFAAVVDRTVPGKRLFGGLLVHPVGKGGVVYASLKLWQDWSPADPLFGLFHQDLLARNPAVALRNAPFFGSDVQVAAFERGVMARNVGAQARLAVIEATGRNLFAGPCLNVVRQATESGLQVQAGLTSGALGIYERTPIRCVIERGTAVAAVDEYGPAGIKIAVCGGKPRISLSREGVAVMKPSSPQPVRLIIGDGRYPVRPGSLHRLRVKDEESGKLQEYQIKVGADARIEIDKTFYCEVMTLTPLAAKSTP